MQRLAEAGNPCARQLARVMAPGGQTYLSTVETVLHKPNNQDVVVSLLNAVGDYFRPLRPSLTTGGGMEALLEQSRVLCQGGRSEAAPEGLSALLNTIEQVRDSVNPELEVFGILRTMFDPRINLSNEVSLQLIEHFDRKVFRTCVPRNVRLAEAPSHSRPIHAYDLRSRGAQAYLHLGREYLSRREVADGR